MSKKVLAIYYSQSGQLGDIIDNFTQPLIDAGIEVEKVRVRLVNEPVFPWTADTFFSVMPDCQLDVPAELEPFELQSKKYDLVILGYQAWFLSPSIPFNSLMLTGQMQTAVKNTPVITITGARNMWLSAFVRVKKILRSAKANHVGNIALVDTHPNPVSFVTIFHWMLHGKKDRYLNIFPPPGVSDADIKHTKVFGNSVIPHLMNDDWESLQAELDANKAAVLNYNLMVIESTASKIFKAWAMFISKRKNKLPWIRAYKYYLLIAFFVGAPILITLDGILFRFTSPKRIRAKKQYYLNLN
ncbi:hypothetical protein ACFS5N_04815 [Mucilaginibacter ximonensis]|uniref:Flavodoxin-like protein n=1 Tax=Mucilaginibacter ximonensis TaxID=538021 RepID=A0ABW5Y906_9SPHI